MRNALKMMVFALALMLAPGTARAANCAANPNTLTNGSLADATSVMANFNNLLNCSNNNLAHNGANSDITSLSALSTPLSVAQGGTGTTTSTGAGSVVLSANPTLSGTVTMATATATSLGIGMTPVNILDITQNTAGGAVTKLLNNSASTTAYANLALSNGTNNASLFMFGASYTTAGIQRQDGMLVGSAGAGGVTVNTYANQPVYIGVNSTQVAQFAATALTLASDLLFTDATYDVGKSGATRPRDGFFSRNLTVGGTIGIRDTSAAFDVTLAATSSVNLTAGRTLTLDVANAARTLKINGNSVINQDVSTAGSPSFVGIVGTTTNNDANAGSVGEYVVSTVTSASPVALGGSNVVINITSISLTAGDWDVSGLGAFTGFGNSDFFSLGISTTSASIAGIPGTMAFTQVIFNNTTPAASPFMTVGPTRLSISTTTTVYLVARSQFSTGAPSAFGQIRARRVR